MKWVALLLLLANAVFFAVQLNTPPEKAAPILRFPYKGKDLVTLAEKEKLDRAKAFAKQNRDKRLAALQAKQQSEVSKPSPAPKPVPVPTPTPEPQVVAEPVVKAEPKPVTKPEPVVPQKQVKVVSTPATQPAPVPKPVVAPSSSSALAKACYAVGPFLLMSDVGAAAEIFERHQIYAAQRAKAQRKQVGYWVYVPPLASVEAANAALKRIQESGLLDVQLITEGTKANALSVGVYQAASQAEQRSNMIDDMGLAVKTEPLYRTQPQYWLDVELMDTTKLSSKIWNEVSSGRPNIRQERRKCN